MRTFARSLLAAGSLAWVMACSGSGSLELSLSMPTAPALRPVGMTTVTVTATPPGESPIANTNAVGASGTFSAGDLPIGDDIHIGVVLRDVSNRIVGVGDADQPVDIVGDSATKVDISVRRPFVFANASDGLHSFDPTLDPRDVAFQGKINGVGSPLFSISVGGDRLAVVSNAQIFVVDTATNMVRDMITIPQAPRDATAVPGTNKIVVAHPLGITVADLDTKAVETAAVGPVDRVTVGPSESGALYAYGLVGRVVAPELPSPLEVCTGTSSIVAVSIDAPAVTAPKTLGEAVSDLAAAPDVPGVFAALPCDGQVAKLVGDPSNEVGTLSLQSVATLSRAAVLTVAGNRIWAAGTQTATPVCETPTCSTTSVVSCTASGGGNDVLYVNDGASLIVQSIPLDGGPAIVFNPPGRRETMIDLEDEAGQHAQVLKAIGAVPVDLVTLPGGQYVSLIAKSRYYIAPLGFVLPCLDAETSDWLLFDLASSSVAQRVRTFCSVEVSPPNAAFPDWACEAPPPAEASPAEYQPISVGALFGAR